MTIDDGLELSPEAMRSMLTRAGDEVISQLAQLDRDDAPPIVQTRGSAKIARALDEPLPEQGEVWDRIATLIFRKIVPASLNTAAPGYFGYIPGGGIFHAAIADFITAAMNRYVGIHQAAPALAEIEGIVIRWFAAILGMPASSRGVLTSGGSMANLIAIVTARTKHFERAFDRGTIYASDQTHQSIAKAARIAGLPIENVRTVASDATWKIDLRALDAAIDEDVRRGFTPFLLIGNAGTTNTGAVDDLRALSDRARRSKIWFHVDATYGGFFALTDRGKQLLSGIEDADSVALDPHKSLFLPYGTGSLLVRDSSALRDAHAVRADYLPPAARVDEGPVDFADLSPELSREARGLRVWIPMKMHGASTFRAQLDEKIDLARHAADALRTIPGVKIVAEPTLSLLAFRYKHADDSPAEADAKNRRILSIVRDRKRTFLSGTILDGRFTPRICVLSFRSHRAHVDRCIDDVAAAIQEVAGITAPL